MMLYLKKMGSDFRDFDPETDKKTDLENCRLRLEFIDKKGRRVLGDISHTYTRALMIHPSLAYECHNGTYDYFSPEGYKMARRYSYTKADVLEFVNRFSAIRYTGVRLVDDLPEVQYPEEVLQLERDCKEHERRSAFEELLQSIRETPVKWRWIRPWQAEEMTRDEFKEITLTAAKTLIEGVAWSKLSPENRVKRIADTFSDLHKRGEMNLYDDTCPINPLHDLEFMAQLVEIDPAFAYPMKEYTPEEFAHLATE